MSPPIQELGNPLLINDLRDIPAPSAKEFEEEFAGVLPPSTLR